MNVEDSCVVNTNNSRMKQVEFVNSEKFGHVSRAQYQQQARGGTDLKILRRSIIKKKDRSKNMDTTMTWEYQERKSVF